MDSASSDTTLTIFTRPIKSFAIDLYKSLSQNEGNIFFSPYGISLALSMLLRGAKEETETEIKHVLHLEAETSTNDVLGACNKLLHASKNSDACMLMIANSVLLQKNFCFSSDFTDDIKESFEALISMVDFEKDSKNILETVNEWAKDKTENTIPKILDSCDPQTVLLLLNAVYFKGTWRYQFDQEKTTPGIFYNNGLKDTPKEVDMMNMKKQGLRFMQTETCKILELPYKGDNMVMILLLPQEIGGLKELEGQINNEFMSNIALKLRPCEVNIFLPKVHVEFSTGLKQTLKQLGMKAAFECNANLSRLSPSGQLFVSSIFHKACADINEVGTEAAAVTRISIMKKCAKPYFNFHADHPFIFIIYEKSLDLILFMGRINEF